MANPSIPRVRTENSKIHSPLSRCGDNWWMDVKIRAPYKGTDSAFRTLPSLGDPSQVEELDSSFSSEISADIDRVSKFVSEHARVFSDRQHSNIEKMLERATSYNNDAAYIWKCWDIGFSTPSHRQIKWPLTSGSRSDADAQVSEGRRRDISKWKKLIRAALKNLRCAEEIAKRATIRHRNKEKRGDDRSSGILTSFNHELEMGDISLE